MSHADSHISDEQLLLDLDGELSAPEGRVVRAHLQECWQCRSRRQELENAISVFMRDYQGAFDPKLPDAAGPRALLKARMAQVAAEPANSGRRPWFSFWKWAPAAAIAMCLLAWPWIQSRVERQGQGNAVVSVPNSSLTPGAAILAEPRAVCAQANVKNRAVSPALQRAVFAEYGITGDRTADYEVDYLITPALGGAEDIHNLWPQSHAHTQWNADVKDALEDRLREMVCDGRLNLDEAQREIAGNWIDAYKKYFNTDRPLLDRHVRAR